MLGDLNTAVCIKQPLPNLSPCPIYCDLFFCHFSASGLYILEVANMFWVNGWFWSFNSEWLVGWPLVRSHNDCSSAAGSETTSEKETENESDD